MKLIEVTINGEAYPCSPTMGAMLRFKQQTGKEISEIDTGSFTDLCTYLWCCVASASKREGKDFNMSLMEFADSITRDDMVQWSQSVPTTESVPDESGEKKSPQGSVNS